MYKALLSRFSDSPSLVSESQIKYFEGCLHALSQSPDLSALLDAKAEDGDEFWDPKDPFLAARRPYIVRGGVLQIPVAGVLLNNFPWQIGGWATGYQYISRAFQRGLADPEVSSIAFVINSPGGNTAECFDLTDRIQAAKGQKPVGAFAYEMAFSAAYAIAASADSIVMSRTGGVGSIGCVMMHVDFSKAMDAAGVKVTFVSAPEGGHKTDGNPYEPLGDETRARMQARVDESYQTFVSTVANGRGMTEDAVRETKALTFTATQALSNGLADEVAPFDEALAAFAANSTEKGTEMTEKSKQTDDTSVDASTHQTAVANAEAKGFAEGVSAERGRINAILSSEEGKARPKAALSAALKTDMTAEQVTAFIADLPEEKAEASTGSNTGSQAERNAQNFDAAMSADNPDVGAGDDESGKGTEDDVTALAANFGLSGFKSRQTT